MEAAFQTFADRVGSFHVQWKPFFLNEKLTDEGMPIVTYLERKYGPEAGQAARSKSGNLHKTGAKLGIEFNSERFATNTMRSHCLLDYAATISEAKQNELAEALFHGHFTEGNKLSNAEFLLKAASQVGLDCEAAKRHMESEKVKEKVHDEYVSSVQKYGVTGVPFFIINSDTNEGAPYAFSGAQPPESFCSIFERLLGSSASL